MYILENTHFPTTSNCHIFQYKRIFLKILGLRILTVNHKKATFSHPTFSFFIFSCPSSLYPFHHLLSFLFSSPSSPPSPKAATPVSLKVRVRDFCYSLTVIFLLYNNVCNVCIVFSITILNIKFKCGLGLLDELYYLVPRPNHLAICLVIINVI